MGKDRDYLYTHLPRPTHSCFITELLIIFCREPVWVKCYSQTPPQIWFSGQKQRCKNRGWRAGMHACCECRLGTGIRQRSLRCWVKHGSPPAMQDPWGVSPLCLTEKWIKAKKQKWQPLFGLISFHRNGWLLPKPLDRQQEGINALSLPPSLSLSLSLRSLESIRVMQQPPQAH